MSVPPERYYNFQDLVDRTQDTAARLANPGLFLIVILRMYWLEATTEEATAHWRTTVRDNPGYAIDMLNCLHQIIEDPPPDLARLFVDQGRVFRYHTDERPYRPFDGADYREWLLEVYEVWSAIFEVERSDG
jgi:hypothetical protein